MGTSSGRMTPGASPPRASASSTPPSPTSAPARPGANTYVSETDNGEVTLKPTDGVGVLGQLAPGRLDELPWTTQSRLAGRRHGFGWHPARRRRLRQDRPRPTRSGRSLEFGATFNGRPNQHVGFAVDLNDSPNWAIFSIKVDGSTLHTPAPTTDSPGASTRRRWGRLCSAVRTSTGSSGTRPRSATTWTAAWWRPTPPASAPRRCAPIASDLNSGGPELTVDWMRMSPYPGSGTFDSRVFDAGAGQIADWGALSWNSATPSGTGIAHQRPHGRHAHPRRDLERLHPDRLQRRRHPGQQPLRPVPGSS